MTGISVFFSKKGFTLVETVLSVAIFLAVSAALYSVMISGQRTLYQSQANLGSQGQVRKLLDMVTRDIRETESVSITQSAGLTNLTLDLPVIGTVTYDWTDSGADANRIIRDAAGVQRIIATEISALSFTDNTTTVSVDVTANSRRGLQEAVYSLTKRVAIR